MRSEPKPRTEEEAKEEVLSALKIPSVEEARVIDDKHDRTSSSIPGMQRRRVTVLVFLTENTTENLNAVRTALNQLASTDITPTGMSPVRQHDPGWGDDMGVWTFELFYHAPAAAHD